MKPWEAPTATAAIVMPSMRLSGSPSISIRSENVPESPSSALQVTYFWPAGCSSTVFHLIPVGKAAPPRPRKPEPMIASTTDCGLIASARRRP
jgi:hypothetical protein